MWFFPADCKNIDRTQQNKLLRCCKPRLSVLQVYRLSGRLLRTQPFLSKRSTILQLAVIHAVGLCMAFRVQLKYLERVHSRPCDYRAALAYLTAAIQYATCR